VRTKHSATPFACGARDGVRTISIPSLFIRGSLVRSQRGPSVFGPFLIVLAGQWPVRGNRKVTQAPSAESFRKALDGHGFGFQYAVLAHIETAGLLNESPWRLASAEVPVKVHGEDLHVDFVLERQHRSAYVAAECKRVDPLWGIGASRGQQTRLNARSSMASALKITLRTGFSFVP
jgi:hypothetical protein